MNLAKPMDQTKPTFVFERRHHVELETGQLLAGQLFVNIPKETKLKRRHIRLINEIIQRLLEAAQSGQMPHDAFILGWQGGGRPPNANTDDDSMAAWAEKCLIAAVRIDPRNDGMMPIDSDILKQITTWN